MDLFRVDRYMGDDEVVESQHNENSRFNQLQRDIENRRRKRKSLQNESSAPLSLNNPDFVANNLQSKEDLVLVEKKKAKKKKKTSMVDMHDELEGESEKKVSKRSSKSDSKNKDGNGKVRKLSVEMHVVRDDVELEDIVEKRKEKKKKKKDKVDHDSKEGKDCEEDTNVEEKQITEEISQGKKSKNTKFDSKEGNDIEEDTNVEEKQNTEQISQTEPTGFTVIGGQKKDKVVKKVQRVLPDWLAKPTVINTDLSKSLIPVEDMSCLDPLLVSTLQRHNIDHLFPVQSVVIPTVLSQMDTNTCFSKGGYQPSDICVSAPTGSGKTLAYVLPIVQSLLRRVVRHLRALILLPTKDLANQVKQVFEMFTEGTGLRVGLASGSKSFSKDQEQLTSQSACGSSSRVDILVCTPGRLVDHISSTPHFSLQHVRFLVIDEADRLLDQSYHGWLRKVLKAAYNNHSSTTQLTMDGSPVSCTLHTIRSPPGAQTPASFSAIQLPLQKLLFSATMTHSPEKLAPLHLYQPVLFTAAAAVNQTGASELSTGTADVLSFGRYTIPEGLSEYMTVCNDGEKPLVVLYCLIQLKFQRVICFASSLEATHRLYLLVKLYGGVEAAEYSSSLTPQQRKGILRDFRLGKLQLLICSDAMARGMDIQDVLYVISYDVPNYVRSYVHRVGRTARAGNEGTAITFLHGDEVHHFKELIHKTGREKIAKYNIKQDNLQSMVEKYQDTLGRLQDAVQVEQQKKRGHKRGTQDVMKMLQEQITSNLLHKDE